MPRGVYQRGPSKARRTTYRTLRPDEPLPVGEPNRYRDRAGYVILRWKVGVREYVEAKEHRVIAGALAGQHVHHRNHVRDDNSPDNLEPLAPHAHISHHGRLNRRVDVPAAIALYEAGYSTPEIGRIQGVDHSNVWRALHRAGYRMRGVREGRAVADQRRSAA